MGTYPSEYRIRAAAIVVVGGVSAHRVSFLCGCMTIMEMIAISTGLVTHDNQHTGELHLFVNNEAVVDAILGPSPHAGQLISIQSCAKLHKFFESDDNCIVNILSLSGR